MHDFERYSSLHWRVPRFTTDTSYPARDIMVLLVYLCIDDTCGVHNAHCPVLLAHATVAITAHATVVITAHARAQLFMMYCSCSCLLFIACVPYSCRLLVAHAKPCPCYLRCSRSLLALITPCPFGHCSCSRSCSRA